MTLDQLQILLVVAELGSFSAAARKLNRVQSAVSQSIQSLEDALQLQLFDRSHKLPRLTDAGRAILADAKRTLSSADALRARANSIATVAEPEITLAIEQVFPNAVLIESLNEFRSRYPLVSVTLFAEGLGAPEQSLLDGNARLAIYSPAFDGMPGIQLQFMGDVPISVVASADHPLARVQGLISQAELDEHVQLTLTDRTKRYRGVVMGSRTWSFVDQINRLDFVLRGFGWCTMPTHLAWPHIEAGRLVELQLAIHQGRPLMFPLYAAHKVDQPPGLAAQWLLQDLQERFTKWLDTYPRRQGPAIQIRITVARNASADHRA
ncbi:LysR family transcriptional regulator [Rhodoligotrophos defluvii]|uniref:LysR family transcriptional regulator n=1 Tax=Rhodoligotrophos defluvii TaxID=2561934 RepID=UPI0014852C4B|nr:LysR family transcriptional regulator [Rhodoligotrophos defluvii]